MIDQDENHSRTKPRRGENPVLMFLKNLTPPFLGIGLGDIISSIAYVITETIYGHNNLTVNEVNVYGVTSMIFWLLMFLTFVLLFMLNVTYKKHGGIFAQLEVLEQAGGSILGLGDYPYLQSVPC